MMPRKSRAMREQIKALSGAGHPIRKIAKALGISRNTVRSYLREQATLAEDPPKALAEPIAAPSWVEHVDWDKVSRERKAGVTARQLYVESGVTVSYSQFAKHLQRLVHSSPVKPAPALVHNPGEKVQVDYADGLELTDPHTGKKRKTQLFCAVLPFSSFTFAEFCLDQRLPTFLSSHERMWAYFGGVTPYVVIDNLKSGVTKAHRYDPDVNPTYCDYGNHCGFAVLPARPYTPRDKASVEAAIGVIQRAFYQQHRNNIFYSIDQLNLALRSYLEQLNAQVMAGHGVSRLDRFAIEKPHLLALPFRPYELVEFKEAKVHPDCCIQVAKAIYSVPFQYVSQSVRVKLSDRMVIIFDKTNNEIAAHPRKPEYGNSILEAHLPAAATQMRCFDVVKSKAKAKAIGPKTEDYVHWQFDEPRPLRVLRRVQGVLRLHDNGLSREAMEYAAIQALQFRRRDLRYFSNCANYFAKTGGKPFSTSHPVRDPSTLHLRGGS